MLDLRNDAENQCVYLRPEGISDICGLIGNLVIARNTVIRILRGRFGRRRDHGNAAGNTLEVRHGADTLHGLASDDTAGCWGFFSLTKRSRWWWQTITIFSETVKQEFWGHNT